MLTIWAGGPHGFGQHPPRGERLMGSRGVGDRL